MSQHATERSQADGFTLVELLIAIAVMAVVLPALAAAFYVAGQTIDGTTDRVNGSSAVTLASTWFGPDVQSAAALSTTAVAACGLESGQTALLTTVDKHGAVATWYEQAGALGRRGCDGSTTSDWIIPLAPNSSIVRECQPSCAVAFSTISLRFTPLEGQPVVLSSARRNS